MGHFSEDVTQNLVERLGRLNSNGTDIVFSMAINIHHRFRQEDAMNVIIDSFGAPREILLYFFDNAIKNPKTIQTS
jgi:hypothetical protein